mgnify:CR=1 FL=1
MVARIKKDDTVIVIAGKDKGRSGKVLAVLPKEDRVVVEGVNMVKRHTKAAQGKEGGILDKEGSIHMSNVMPIDPSTDKATRVKVQVKDDVRHRVGKSGAVIEAQR